MKLEWFTGWPTEVGDYWFYGYTSSMLAKQSDPRMLLVSVKQGGNSLLVITGNRFLFRGEGAEGYWAKMELPDPPLGASFKFAEDE